ncbi:MAG: hypothetical protein Q9209_005294 [Squamulea sp. 1 TL-2023]
MERHVSDDVSSSNQQCYERKLIAQAIELLPHGSRPECQANREKPKIALSSDYITVSLAVFVQLLPVLITVAIVYLTGASIYWTDLGHPNQNSILNGLQFVSKFHEIAITTSLTAIVLHRVCYDLVKTSGVPLGFLSSAYQLGSLIYPISTEFWGGARSTKPQRGWRRWFPLWLFIPIACFLAAAVGPASAIVMIPSLEWWPVHNPLNNTMISVFLPLNSSQIWPTTIDAPLLESPGIRPESANCSADMAYKDPLCPSGGFDDIIAWAINHMSRAAEPNITLTDIVSGVSRYLTSNMQPQSCGWAVSSALGLRQARDFGTFWQYLQSTDLQIKNLSRPLFEPSLAGSPQMKKPIVQTQCALFKEGSPDSEDIRFPTSELRSPSLDFEQSKSWGLPDRIDVSAPSNGIVDFHWVDMADYTDEAGLLGGVFISTTPDGSTGVFPCTILTHWVSVNIWGDPKISPIVFQDSSEPISIVSSLPNGIEAKSSNPSRTLEPISIDLPWLSALNLPNRLPSELKPSVNLTLLETSASAFGFLHANLSWRLDPQGGDNALPGILATLLSMHLADGLSRVNSGFPTVLYHRGEFPDGQGGTGTVKGVIKNMDNRNIERWLGMPLDSGRLGELYADQARSTNASHNTEVIWKVKRYGYGWGFDIGVTVILATAILLLHVLMAMVHLIFMLGGRWGVATFCKSPSEMVVLGLESREQGVEGLLANTSAGINEGKTWGKMVKVRARTRESNEDETLSIAAGEVPLGKGRKEGKIPITSLELVLDGELPNQDEPSQLRIRKNVYYN